MIELFGPQTKIFAEIVFPKDIHTNIYTKYTNNTWLGSGTEPSRLCCDYQLALLFTELHCHKSWDNSIKCLSQEHNSASIDINLTTLQLLFGNLMN